MRVDRIFHRTKLACPHVLSLTVARHTETAELSQWVDSLPGSNSLCVHICLKGMRCDGEETMSAFDSLRNVTVHSCVEEPGGSINGHEGVCAFRFLLDNYNEHTWTHVYFAHGDMHKSKHKEQYGAMKTYLANPVWPVWPTDFSEISQSTCGCVGSFPDAPNGMWTSHHAVQACRPSMSSKHVVQPAVHARYPSTLSKHIRPRPLLVSALIASNLHAASQSSALVTSGGCRSRGGSEPSSSTGTRRRQRQRTHGRLEPIARMAAARVRGGEPIY